MNTYWQTAILLKKLEMKSFNFVIKMADRISIGIVVLIDALLCYLIMNRIQYTEIDFSTYMQQVDLFHNGERNYYAIKGDTGPLVYPAGFLYIFSGIQYFTDHGRHQCFAQLIFAVFYLLTTIISMKNGIAAKIPVWLLGIASLSRRAHSIFILRLFNDGPVSLLSQLSVYMFVRKKWFWGCAFLSLAVSVKMNALLYAPGVTYILFSQLPFWAAVKYIVVVCGGIQVLLGLPFLLSHPMAYLHKAFELSRVFEHKWTVNYQFLSEDIFQAKWLSLVLLFATVITYYFFWTKVWSKQSKNLLLILYSSNFIGIVFSRTIHFQFYVWYSFTLPALVFFAKWSQNNVVNWVLRAVVLVGIEFVYNYPGVGDNPSTPVSSAIWHAAHLTLLFGLWNAGSSIVPSKKRQ